MSIPWQGGTVTEDSTGWTTTLTVPASSPLFLGHFDGNPIVPGVALLAAVQRLDPSTADAPRRWHGVKFRAPLKPGETATLSVRRGGDRDAFEIECGNRKIVRGSFARLTDAPTPAIAFDESTSAPLPHPLPHTGPAKAIERVLRRDESAADVVGVIHPEHGLVRNGTVASTMAIEMAAQASSYLGTGPAPKSGYLTTVREAVLHVTDLPVVHPLYCRVQLEGLVRGLRTLSFVVQDQDRVLATGALSTFADT